MTTVVIPSQKTPGWPKKRLRRLEALDIDELLAREWRYDAHFVQYGIVGTIGPYRYNTEAFAHLDGASIHMHSVVVDVDCPTKKTGDVAALDTWWDDELAKIVPLLRDHQGMVWRTKGGWRGCWATLRELRSSDDAKLWRRDYLAFVAYLARAYGVEADAACADWGRLQRVPWGQRAGEAYVERRIIIGARGLPLDIGVVPTEEDRSAARFRWKNAWKDPAKPAPAANDEYHGAVLEGEGVWERVLRARGLIVREIDARKLAIRCPNETEHTSQSDTGTVLYRPSAGEIYGHIHCSHSHCAGLDFRARLGVADDEWRAARPQLAPVIQLVSVSTEDEDRRVVSELIPDAANPSRIAGTAGNVAALLVGHSAWKGKLAYDTFKHERSWRDVPAMLRKSHGANPSVLETDAVHLQSWLLRGDVTFGRPPVNTSLTAIESAIGAACAENSFDSLVDHVLSVEGKWDGEPRLDTWMHRYLGVDDTPLSRAMGARWLIAAVARAIKPGCVADMMPILQGAQAAGKGYLLKILFGEKFVTITGGYKLGSKDSEQRIADTWCAHDDELTSTTKAGLEFTKSYVTETSCKFRKAYDRDFMTVPRRFILVGSTNLDTYLSDAENRRFWPLRVNLLKDGPLLGVRDKLISEAIQYFRIGKEHRIMDNDALWPDLSVAHEEVRIDDPTAEKVVDMRERGHLADGFQIFDILQLLGYHMDRWGDPRVLLSVRKSLKTAGYNCKRIGGGKNRKYRWFQAVGSHGDRGEAILMPKLN